MNPKALTYCCIFCVYLETTSNLIHCFSFLQLKFPRTNQIQSVSVLWKVCFVCYKIFVKIEAYSYDNGSVSRHYTSLSHLSPMFHFYTPQPNPWTPGVKGLTNLRSEFSSCMTNQWNGFFIITALCY